MATASELISQGRTEELWNKYCGFLDLSLDEFMQVQERLLREQIEHMTRCELGQSLLAKARPRSVEEFRRIVPLTTFADYQDAFGEKRDDIFPRTPYIWARTSGRSGVTKWVPYSREAYEQAGERIMASIILAMARERGEVRLAEQDVLVYNTPPRPYSSGIALMSTADHFGFRFVPPLDLSEEISFQQRLELSFQMALRTGIDVIGSITSVLVKIGERFAQGASSGGMSRQVLHPQTMARLLRGWVRSRLAGRPMLPKDLWTVKALMCGGTDTSLYKDVIEDYWGITPTEMYASTETVGTVAVQAWDKKGLYFFPDVVFLEFIPEAEWIREREEPTYTPQTVLLSEVQPDQRYELVITSFDGGPFLRYRMHDLIRFLRVRDSDIGINLPSMEVAGRSDGLIDLAGFTGLMDEPMMWRAIHDTGVPYEDWVVRKEASAEGVKLHVYIELKNDAIAPSDLGGGIHDNLSQMNPYYRDLEEMLEVRPIQVTILPVGTFRDYYLAQQALGADLSHLKPPHMNPSEEILARLLDPARQTQP